ncbi:MAG: DNA mismatch endonuclease Vsr [Candidatus Pacebacteria bacterium]|nr:DNA mismatch endonuclease Vsr [Candidatus Paceibacterota bacterium]
MTDIYSKEKRSNIMSKIRSKKTKPEELVRKYLFSKGFRYRINDKRYPGTPDIVLPKYHTIIFVNGCFWHGHENCKAAKLPKTNTELWKNKILNNIARDKINIEKLKNEKWKVIIIWQCEINTKNNREKRLELLINEINN